MKNRYIVVALKPALVSGSLCIVYFLTFYFAGATLFDGSYNWDMLIPAPFCGILLYIFKKYYNGGELRFWQGLLLCGGVVFGSLILYSFYLMVHLYYLDAVFLFESANWKIDELIRNKEAYLSLGQAEEAIKFQIEALKKPSVGGILADKIIRFSFVGPIYAVILSIIFRK